MIYIKTLELKDFQTHKKTLIDFSPFFNVIVGPTRSGKSSVVRALDFLYYNNWYEDYQRFGSKQVEIKATLSNGSVITRIKSKKVNKIIINTKGKEQRFESFGHSLPQEVINVLGIRPIEIDAKDPIEANIANQDDPLFLLYTTATERTKVLSRLSGLHWIDFALKDISKDKRTKNSDITLLKESNVGLKEKLKAFKNLKMYREQLNAEQSRLARIIQFSNLTEKGRMLIQCISQWKKEYASVQQLKSIDFATETTRLEKLVDIQTNVYQKLIDVSCKLQSNEISLHNINAHILHLEAEISDTEADLTEEMQRDPICETCGQLIKEEVHIDD